MPLILPVVDAPDGSFVTSLEGERFRFSTRWNDRTGNWYLAVSDTDENVIMSYEKIIQTSPLVNHNITKFVDGNIYAISSVLDNPNLVGRTNFGVGKEYQLFYISLAELLEV